MKFTAFKIPAEAIAQRLAELQTGFAASGKPGAFADNALRVVGERLQARPAQYLEFGPYWWAVKAALAPAGYEFGSYGDPLVASEYTLPTPVETLVAAEAFKDYYRATFLRGHNQFDLAGDGEAYELDDPDMRERIAA